MKKVILGLSIILLSSFASANPGMALPFPSQRAPNAFERFLNTPITKEGVTVGAKRVGGVIVANKARMAIGLGSTLAIGGVVWYNYLIQHPEKMSEFFAVHPDMLDKFTQYVDYRIEHAQTQEDYDAFTNVKQQLALDQNVNNAQSVAINNDPAYQQLENVVRQEVDQTLIAVEQSGRMPSCNINVVAQLLEPKSIFKINVNNMLPNTQHQRTQMLDVNSFKALADSYKSNLVRDPLTPDHIPSYGALANYFKQHGYTIPKRSNSDLEANSSSIMVPTALHQNGSRTYGGRNNRKNTNGDTTIQQDSSNLVEATILDIATTAYLFYVNFQYNINPIDYIKNSLVLVERNKLLCMYDVK